MQRCFPACYLYRTQQGRVSSRNKWRGGIHDKRQDIKWFGQRPQGTRSKAGTTVVKDYLRMGLDVIKA